LGRLCHQQELPGDLLGNSSLIPIENRTWEKDQWGVGKKVVLVYRPLSFPVNIPPVAARDPALRFGNCLKRVCCEFLPELVG
jgi:hypothetical protein